MSKNSWILWALILILPGGAGLGYHFAQKNGLQEQISIAIEATSQDPATDEYLQMYDAWSSLDPEEKLENPWGKGQYGGADIQKRLRENQSNQLWADMADLDKGFKHYPDELAETLYGRNWQAELDGYRKRCEIADMTLIGSVLIISSGGLIMLGGLVKVLVVLALRKRQKKTEGTSVVTASEQNTASEATEAESGAQAQADDVEVLPAEVDITAFTESAPFSDAEKLALSNKGDQAEDVDKNDPGYFGSQKTVSQEPAVAEVATAPKTDSRLSGLTASFSAASVSEKPAKDAYFGWAVDNEEAGDELDSLMTTEPLTKELTELTEEMSAIREFAAQQQDQVRKLQDGYDWMIIRRFCMRIIRCIDNIEDRRNRQEDENGEVAICMEDIRDELVFALESSGIEQFEPDLEAPFKGLEKYAEAVRGRVETDNAELSGTIAKVVRPGYQYLISEDDVKIVRCAQVQLYEANQNE